MHGMADHRQLGESPGQVGDAGALAVRGIDGERQVRTLTEDRLHQAGQPVAGTDLQETGDAGGVHRLDLGDEFDRLGELGRQLGLGRRRVRRVDGRRGVGIDR